MESRKQTHDRKKLDHISLKTNLPNYPISEKLKSWKSQSVSEILNQPIKEKKKFSLNFLKGALKKGFKGNTIIPSDINKTFVDLDVFNTMEVLTESSFRTEINTRVNRTTIDQQYNNPNKNNLFKTVVKENYSDYIKLLKRIYPSFKFNHYKKKNKQRLEYYKKYGEEGDINNRNLKIKDLKEEKNNSFDDENIIYKPSNLLDILGVQDNISVDSDKFKIKENFLTRNEITEIKMIQKDLSFKTGVIDKELDHILMTYAPRLYKYIDNHKNLNRTVKEMSSILRKNKEKRIQSKKKYIRNSAGLITKGFKKVQMNKTLIILKEINKIIISMNYLKNISFTQNENKIKLMNDAINVVKEKIKIFNANYNNDKKYKFIIGIEQVLKLYEFKGQENLIDQFNISIKKIINKCLVYFNNENNINENNEEIQTHWDLSKENDEKNKIFFIEDDFILIDNQENLYINYLLIYNNISSNNNIFKLLTSILDMFEIIIKDNLDISDIVSAFQDVFIKLVNKNKEIIQNSSKNKLLVLNIMSHCFSIILSNYFYIILLIQNNFGFRTKIFGEVTELIKSEMDKNISELILDYFDNILNNNNWKYFLKEVKNIPIDCGVYLNYRHLNLFDITIEKYRKFTENFNKECLNEINKIINEKSLNWDQITNIDIKYQKMFYILYSNEEITKLKIDDVDINQIDFDEIIKNISNKKFIVIYNPNLIEENDINHKISKLSLEIINYVYNYLLVFTSINENLQNENLDDAEDKEIRKNLVQFMYNTIKEKLTMSKNLIINNMSGIVNNKPITDKETCIYYSDIFIIKYVLNRFLLLYPEQELSSLLNELETKCIDITVQLISDTINKTFEEFNLLDYKNYPVVNGGKGYNKYVNNFTILKRIYDNMNNCYSVSEINKMFGEGFENILNKMKESINEKGIIDNDEELKQIRNEFNYIKKVFKLFPLVDCAKFKEITDEMIIKVNPDKLPVNKKKKNEVEGNNLINNVVREGKNKKTEETKG